MATYLPEYKTCTKCKERKSLDSFYKCKQGKYGRRSFCSECSRSKINSWRRNNREKSREVARLSYVQRQYNLSPKEYKELRKKQNNCCRICNISEQESMGKRLHIDHCHTTGKVRGLLCASCNLGLGYFKDNIELMSLAILYLEEEQEDAQLS